MTAEEHEKLVDVSKEFWEKFSALCNEYIAKAPKYLEAEYTMHLGEQTSIYGRKTD